MNTPLTRAALERAMSNDELVLHYQPKVCLLSGAVIGAEALVRWADGVNVVVSPDEFLPLAESSGLLHDLTMQLLDQVIDASVELGKTQSGLSLSINVAPNDLASNKISNRIGILLDQRIISPPDLQIEITESAVMGNVDRVYDDLVRLTAMGIRILMDDFGTGYSSIDRLSQLPFDSLKLDQGVVRRMGTSRQNLDVVRSAISMARELGMTSVAEGVESVGAYNFLIANGCEEAQGYFIARPMSLNDLKGFVSRPHNFEGSHIGRVHQALLNILRFRKSLVDAAYCGRIGDGTALESVADPDMSADIKHSRLGLWYFGVGQHLIDNPVFRDIETPLRDMHAKGLEFLQQLDTGATGSDMGVMLMRIDTQANLLIELLHRLERDLLAQKLH